MYDQAIALLTSQEKFHIKLGLERVGALLEYFGNPQDQIKTIHVAGTNGKGSTCAMLESILRHAGYKTGLYTSPHLVKYNERIKINGKDIFDNDFAEIISRVIEYSKKAQIPATEFEILTVGAFIYFYEQNVDYAVVETGLGGRLDATNVIKKPELAIITSIDIDHADRLGDTIEKIAFEKAGIIKQDVPVVVQRNNKGLNVLEKSGVLIFSDNEAETNLMGLWQKQNASLAKKAAQLLKIPEQFINSGLNNVNWPARFQYIKDENIVIDSAHNPAGAKALRESLDVYFPEFKRVFLYSSLKTKDYKEVTKQLFKKEDIVILTKCSSFSAVNPLVISQSMDCCKIYITENIKEAEILFKEFNQNEFLKVIAGSIYTIGEYLSLRALSNRVDFV